MDALNALDKKLKDSDTTTKLVKTFANVVLRGREERGADPVESFQVYVSGYIPFWNDEDAGCDTISWSWFFWD